MSMAAVVTLSTLGLILSLLIFTRRATDVILWGGVTVLLLIPIRLPNGAWELGVMTPAEALKGVSNEGLFVVAVLFVLVTGLRETGGMQWLAERLLGQPKSVAVAQARIMIPVAILSAFMNNTPLVAMMLPVIDDWSKKIRVSTSRLLIPLSYASILGGACTLIGTSTTLVVNGQIIEKLGPTYGLGMFEISLVGIPCAIAGLIYLQLFAQRLLVERRPAIGTHDDPREYTIEMLVEPASPLVGQTIEKAGLRHLPGLFLMEIDRHGQVMAAVSSNVTLNANDRLVFVGVVESVVDLRKIRGLKPATDQVYKLNEPRTNRCLVEAVVSNSCTMVGQTIREGRFRTQYNAAVIAVARNGERLSGKIGDIVLQPGDTLLMETRAAFAEQHRNSRDFFLVSRIEDSTPIQHEKAWISLIILGLLVLVVAMQWMSMIKMSLLAAGLILVTRCCTAAAARRSVEWQVLLVIAAALAIGEAMDTSGAAKHVADAILVLVGKNPHVCLGAIVATTMLFTNVINAKAAALLMLPIAFSTASELDLAQKPFVLGVVVGAAFSFATPIGYQTNLMVFGPGGYRFSDYMRLGIPLSLICLVIGVLLIPEFWSF